MYRMKAWGHWVDGGTIHWDMEHRKKSFVCFCFGV